MNQLSITLLAVFILTVLCSCTIAQTLPAIHKITGASPIIDGSGDDECWKNAAPIPLDKSLGGGIAPIEAKAFVKLTYDDSNLYFYVKCFESNLKNMMAGSKKRDSGIWDDNCVELYFAPSETTPWDYYHIIVNCAGTLTDAIGTGLPSEWNSNGKSAAKTESDSWTAEISIPLKSLNMFPWTTDKVRFNALRLRLPNWEYSSIAGVSHDPMKYYEMNIPGISSTDAVKKETKKWLAKAAKTELQHIGRIESTIPKAYRSREMGSLAREIDRIKGGLDSDDLHKQALAVRDCRMKLDDTWGTAITAEKVDTFDLIAVSPMDKYRKDQLPAIGSSKIDLAVSRGEGESSQIIIRPARDLSAVRVECSELVNSSGYAIKPEVLLEKYIPIKNPNPKSFQIQGLYPDPLVDMEPFDVKAFESQGLWLNVWTPRNAPAGKYSGQISVSAKGVTQKIQVNLHVRNVTLAVTPSLKTHVWMLAVNTAPGLTIDQKNAKNLDILKYRMCTPPTLPWDTVYKKQADGTWTAEWTEFDRVTQLFLDKGCTSFRIESIVPWGNDLPDSSLLPEMKAKLDLLAKHLKEKGWMKWFLFYIFDEVPASKLNGIRNVCNFIHSSDRDFRIIGTINWHVESLVGYIDVWVPHLGAYDSAFTKKARARGEESWVYTCIGAVASNYPQSWIIDYYSHAQRALGWWLWDNKFGGYLYWGVDVFWKDIWNDPQVCPPGNGDGTLYYPDPKLQAGTFPYPEIPSIRLVMHRDGFEDYDLLTMLNDAIRKNPELKSKYGKLLSVKKVVSSSGIFTTNSSLYKKQHDAILAALEEIGINDQD